jgi:hypothetical protein
MRERGGVGDGRISDGRSISDGQGCGGRIGSGRTRFAPDLHLIIYT